MPSSEPSSSKPAPGFVDIEPILRDVHGIIAVISQRRANGVLTVAIFKEFDRDGRIERTAFVPELLVPAYADMVAKARDRMVEIRELGLAPFPFRDEPRPPELEMAPSPASSTDPQRRRRAR